MWVEVHLEVGDGVVVSSNNPEHKDLNGKHGCVVNLGHDMVGIPWFQVKLDDGSEDCFLYGDFLKIKGGDAVIKTAVEAAKEITHSPAS